MSFQSKQKLRSKRRKKIVKIHARIYKNELDLHEKNARVLLVLYETFRTKTHFETDWGHKVTGKCLADYQHEAAKGKLTTVANLES